MAPGHDVEDAGASGLTCPDCGGAIWVDGEAGAPSFNCHTGHRHSDHSMVAGQRSATEAAESEQHANVIRELVVGGEAMP